MPAFDHAVASLPEHPRHGQTPFGAPMVIHATTAETGGALGAWTTITPPGRGPLGHTHTREIELLLVLESTYHFVCGDDEFDAPPGTVVALPPHVPHQWSNAGETTGRMLVLVAPGGCEQLFLDIAAGDIRDHATIARMEAGLGIANAHTVAVGIGDPVDAARAPFPRAVVSFPTDPPNGRTARGDDVLVQLRSAQTGGQLGAWVASIEPGTGPSWHTHSRETEVFVVVSSTFRFWCGDQSFEAGPGSVVALPPHVPHQWFNIGEEPGRLFAVVTPAAFEQMFIDFHAMPGEISDEYIAEVEAGLGVTDGR